MKPGRAKGFYPDYVVEILFVVFLTIEAVLVLAFLFPPGTGRQINFLSQFQPLPEWYFLWLYRLVRYFPARFTFIGTVVIPVFFVGLLVCFPFLDSGRNGRKYVIVSGLFMLLTVIALTFITIWKN